MMIGLVWAGAWTPLGVAIGMRVLLRGPRSAEALALRTIAHFLGVWSLSGAVSGFAFALALPALTRQARVEDVAYGRVAIAGALGALIWTLLFATFLGALADLADSAIPILGLLLLGALSAVATLRFAKATNVGSGLLDPPSHA
jgi:hypothetical protein